MSPRVLMLSHRALQTQLFRSGQVECEDVIGSVDDVELLAPAPKRRGDSRATERAQHVMRKYARIDLKLEPRPERLKLTRDYELFLFYARDPGDLELLERVPNWRSRCAKAVCIMEEIWPRTFIYPQMLRALPSFDLVCVQFHGALELLTKWSTQPVLWLPAAVDTLRFYPGRVPPRRTIDVFGMGRRVEQTHRSLLEHAKSHGWTYLFDTVEPKGAKNGAQMEHRDQIAELIKRTRYFIVNRAKVDYEAQTGGQEEVGHRSFEGAAGGAILIGQTPRGESAQKLFDWPDAHIHVDPASARITEVMGELDRDPERARRISERNVSNMLRKHDWAYRYQAVLRRLGMAEHPRLQQRLRMLEELASSLDQSGARSLAG